MWRNSYRSIVWMLAGGSLVLLSIAVDRGLFRNPSATLDSATRNELIASQVDSLLGSRQVEASSAVLGKNFSLATGPIDEDSEGIFVIDHLTGTLQCSVLNHRTGKFAALFRTNVSAEIGNVKNPEYQLVTGVTNFNRGASVFRPGRSVVYVLESNSGRLLAYGIPWRREAATIGQAQIGSLIPIDALQVRTVQIREQ